MDSDNAHRQRWRLLFRYLGWLVPVLWLYLYLVGPDLFELFEAKTYDFRYRFMPQRPVPPGVVIVDIDTRSLQELGRFPWPRAQLAELIRQTNAYQPRIVLLDIVFSDPDTRSSEASQILRRLRRNSSDADVIEQAINALDHDRQLYQALVDSGRVIGSYYFIRTALEAQAIPGVAKLSQLTQLAGAEVAVDPRLNVETLRLPVGFAAQVNVETVAKGMAGQGFFNMLEDRDGVIRALGHLMIADKRIFSSLSVQAFSFLQGEARPRLVVESEQVSGIQVGSRVLEVDPWGRQYLRFYGPSHTFPYVSAIDVLKNRPAAAQLRGSIVLVGSSAFIQKDLKHAPIAATYPGVEIHATALANMLEGISIGRGNWWSLLDMTIILLGGCILYALLLRSGVLAAGLLIFGALAMLMICSTATLAWGEVWLSFVYPFGSFLTVAGWAIAYKYYTEERQRHWIRGAFSQYLSPALVEDLANHPERLSLGGKEREVTVLFSDIRDFTALSERLKPEQVVTLLNSYFQGMSEHVLAYGGYLDKYIGDAIFVVYGLIAPSPNDAAAACNCALDMTQGLPAVNRRLAEAGFPPLASNIGINTGRAIAGNLGSKTKFNYTVVGDAVNIACRLEGVAKAYGVPIVVGAKTRALAGNGMVFRELDRIQVKGRSGGEVVHQLVGRVAEISPAELQRIQRYESALAEYRNQSWSNALAIWSELEKENDAPSALMAARCRAYLQAPPPEVWDDTYSLNFK